MIQTKVAKLLFLTFDDDIVISQLLEFATKIRLYTQFYIL